MITQWPRLIGPEGFQHNKVLLGEHLKKAIQALRRLPEFQRLTQSEKTLALIAMIFHDIGKPTSRETDDVRRDFNHEIPSAEIAAGYMKRWGFGDQDISAVVKVIAYNGIASDIARGKIRDEKDNLLPEELGELLAGKSVVEILRVVNRADVIATVEEAGFSAIAKKYNEYFEEVSETLSK